MQLAVEQARDAAPRPHAPAAAGLHRDARVRAPIAQKIAEAEAERLADIFEIQRRRLQRALVVHGLGDEGTDQAEPDAAVTGAAVQLETQSRQERPPERQHRVTPGARELAGPGRLPRRRPERRRAQDGHAVERPPADLAAGDAPLDATGQGADQRLAPADVSVKRVRQHVHGAARQGRNERSAGTGESGRQSRGAVARQHHKQIRPRRHGRAERRVDLGGLGERDAAFEAKLLQHSAQRLGRRGRDASRSGVDHRLHGADRRAMGSLKIGRGGAGVHHKVRRSTAKVAPRSQRGAPPHVPPWALGRTSR